MEFGKEYFDFCKDQNNCDFRHKGGWQEKYVEFIMRVFDIKGKRAMDFGSALGSLGSAFTDAGVDMYGADIAEWYVDNCPFQNMIGKLDFFRSPEMITKFEDEFFDFVHSQQVIEHISLEMAEKEFKELFRISKPGAIFYIGTMGHSDEPIEERGDPTHISCFHPEVWHELLKKCGWELTHEFDAALLDEWYPTHYQWVQFVCKRI